MIESFEQLVTQFLFSANTFFQQVGFWPVLLFVYLVGGYVFWKWCMIAQKNKNSVFDLWLFSTLIMAVWSRISFIIANSAVIFNLPWTLFPYERYGDQIYLFRTLPWKLFSIWDGGYFFSGLAVSFLIVAANYSVFVKKWRWRDMYKPVMLALHFMFSGILVVYGLLLQSERISLLSLGIFLLFIAYLIIDKIVSKKGFVNHWGMLIFVIVVTALEGYIFLSSQITDIDRANMFFYIGYSTFVSIMYMIDILKKDALPVDYVPVVKPKVIKTNRPIKIKTTLKN